MLFGSKSKEIFVNFFSSILETIIFVIQLLLNRFRKLLNKIKNTMHA